MSPLTHLQVTKRWLSSTPHTRRPPDSTKHAQSPLHSCPEPAREQRVARHASLESHETDALTFRPHRHSPLPGPDPHEATHKSPSPQSALRTRPGCTHTPAAPSSCKGDTHKLRVQEGKSWGSVVSPRPLQSSESPAQVQAAAQGSREPAWAPADSSHGNSSSSSSGGGGGRSRRRGARRGAPSTPGPGRAILSGARREAGARALPRCGRAGGRARAALGARLRTRPWTPGPSPFGGRGAQPARSARAASQRPAGNATPAPIRAEPCARRTPRSPAVSPRPPPQVLPAALRVASRARARTPRVAAAEDGGRLASASERGTGEHLREGSGLRAGDPTLPTVPERPERTVPRRGEQSAASSAAVQPRGPALTHPSAGARGRRAAHVGRRAAAWRPAPPAVHWLREPHRATEA